MRVNIDWISELSGRIRNCMWRLRQPQDMSALFVEYAHRDRVCMCAFIEASLCACCEDLHLYCISYKKIYSLLMNCGHLRPCTPGVANK